MDTQSWDRVDWAFGWRIDSTPKVRLFIARTQMNKEMVLLDTDEEGRFS